MLSWGFRTPILGLVLLCGLQEAFASHYALVDIDQFSAPERERLESLGLRTTEDLLNRACKKKDRISLGHKARMDTKILEQWVKFCDLLRINGVGPTMAQLFQSAGLTDIALLKKETPESLLEKIRLTNERLSISEILPTVEHLRAWLQQAQHLPLIVN